ncbi:MAG: hypothetical protein LBV73_28690 [Paraburkholderia sp.]|jgi:hypothetical protein|nr:hypothetical protein [Paraburkholderia sp.]
MRVAIVRCFFLSLCTVALASGALADTTAGVVPADAAARQYQSPLQRNFDTAKTVPAKDPEEVDRRCKEIAAAYVDEALSGSRDQTSALQNYNQRKSFDQANGALGDSRRATEQMNALQGDYSAGNAMRVYRDSGCQ